MSPGDILSLAPEDALAEGFAQTTAALYAASVRPDPAVAAALRAAARAVSRATADGHTCLPLADLSGSLAIDVATLRSRLLDSGLAARAGDPERKPLVIDGDDRLYLERYHAAERRVALALIRFGPAPLDARATALIADRLGPRPTVPPADQDGALAGALVQRTATERALVGRLAIVSGGPGTGKTTTVVRILALLLELDPGCRILLAAPTGKAAARLRDAVRAGGHATGMGLSEALRAVLPDEGFTVHRLLEKARTDGGRLACDVLVVDEASMLDLLLADRLLAALAPGTRLILLGDRDQLAAVEAGAVFAEISAADAETNPSLHQRCAELTHSFRFGSQTPLGRVAGAARRGDVEAVLAGLDHGDALLLPDAGHELDDGTLERLVDGYQPLVDRLRAGADPAELFAALSHFRALCAVREGARGVQGLNQELARRIRRRLGLPRESAGAGNPWFAGRPVLVTRNDPRLKLYNGDVGIALPAAGGGFAVYFEDASAAAGFRALSAARLPPHETALAMTVHKAQGSEFGRVALVLPAAPSPICTRELFYTGITRARHAVTVIATPEQLRATLATRSPRHSGLGARLREVEPVPPPG